MLKNANLRAFETCLICYACLSGFFLKYRAVPGCSHGRQISAINAEYSFIIAFIRNVFIVVGCCFFSEQ